MFKFPTLKGLGATPGKLALIGVLAVVFAGLQWSQFGGPTATRPRLTKRAQKVPAASGAGGPKTSGLKKKLASREPGPETAAPPPWPSMELARVTRYDPFALPAAWQPTPVIASEAGEVGKEEDVTEAPRVSREEMERDIDMRISELKRRGIDMILISGSQRLAIIESRTLQIGDVYDGFRVVGINADSLTLEPVE